MNKYLMQLVSKWYDNLPDDLTLATAKQYRKVLLQLLNWLEANNLDPLNPDIEKFVELKGQTVIQKTLTDYLNILEGFYQFFHPNKPNPVTTYKTAKQASQEPLQDDLKAYFDAWLADLQEDLAVVTCTNYARWVKYFLVWCLENNVDPLNPKVQGIVNYVKAKRETVSTQSILKYLQAVETFYHYLKYTKLLPQFKEENPVEYYRQANKRKLRRGRTISHPKASLVDVRRLAFEARSIRVRTSAALLLEGGLRNKELLMLDVDHLNLSDHPKTITILHENGNRIEEEKVVINPWCVYIRYGKGTKGENPREILLVGRVRQILLNYLRWRETQQVNDPQLFFTRARNRERKNNRLGEEDFRYLYCKACEELGITSGASKGCVARHKGKTYRIGVGAIYPRQIRPLFRSEMSMRGKDKKVIDLQMGHTGQDVGEYVYNQRTYKERLKEHLRVGPLLA